MFNEFFQVTLEVLDSIADAGLVAGAMISRKILSNFTVIARDVNGLVVFPDNRLVVVGILGPFCLSGPVGLSMSDPVGWSVHGGESPVLDNQAVLKPENVEEDVSSGSLPFSLGNDVGAILECPYHSQLQLITRRLIDELRQPFHTVDRVRIVLHKALVVDVLRCKFNIPGADALKYRRHFLDVSFRHCLISFSQVDWGPAAVMGLRPYVGPQRVRRT